jgi:hypothetical protein
MHVVAEIGASDAAGFAVAAGDGWFEGETISWVDSGYSGSSLQDDSRRLVSQHYRVAAVRISNASFGVVVHVGAADSYGGDLHLDLSRLRFGDGLVYDLKLADAG